MTIKIPAPKPTELDIEAVYSFLSQSKPGLTHYTMVFRKGAIACTCKGYHFGGECWHVKVVDLLYYSCLCGRRFKSAQGLRNHMRVHRRKA